MPSATDLWFIESRSNPPKSNDRSVKVAEITLYGLYCDYFVLMVSLSNDFSDRIHGATGIPACYRQRMIWIRKT